MSGQLPMLPHGEKYGLEIIDHKRCIAQGCDNLATRRIVWIRPQPMPVFRTRAEYCKTHGEAELVTRNDPATEVAG